MSAGLHISISAEPLFSVGGLEVSNSIFTSLIVSLTLIIFAILVRTKLTTTSRPQGLQNFAEMIVESLYGLVQSVTNNHKRTLSFLPFVGTFLLFILLNNWLGLFPGVGTIGLIKQDTESHAEQAQAAEHLEVELTEEEFVLEQAEGMEPKAADIKTEPVLEVHHQEDTDHGATSDEHAVDSHAAEEHGDEHAETSHTKFVPILRPGTADLNTTLALAIFSVLVTQFLGIQYLSLGYFKKFINFSNPIMFFVGILELISEFAKIVSFAFRLFGNIFAGEVLLVVISFLLPLVAPLPFYGLEVFVGFIQALVFAMLSLVFFNMATHSHDEH